MKIICFGDSITGYRPGQPYLHQYLKWPDILGAMLEVSLNDPVIILNHGYAGDATEAFGENIPGAVNRLEREVLEEQPDLVIVLLGANDAGIAQRTADLDAEQRFEANLGAITKQLMDAQIRVLLLQYHLTRAAVTTTGWHHGSRFNPAIARVAATHEVPVAPLEPAFAAAVGNYLPEELLDQVDGLHLRPAGELVVAKAVFKAIRASFPDLFPQTL